MLLEKYISSLPLEVREKIFFNIYTAYDVLDDLQLFKRALKHGHTVGRDVYARVVNLDMFSNVDVLRYCFEELHIPLPGYIIIDNRDSYHDSLNLKACRTYLKSLATEEHFNQAVKDNDINRMMFCFNLNTHCDKILLEHASDYINKFSISKKLLTALQKLA
jgi:hypothetical protein